METTLKEKRSLKNFRFNLYPKYLFEENCRYYSKMSVNGKHLVSRRKVASEFEDGESKEYLYYMEYLVKPISLRDKNDTDVKHYLERVQDLEDEGYELVCSGHGNYGVSIFRTEDGTLRVQPPKNTYHKCVRNSFGLFLSFLLWMMAITLLDWVWLGRNNFFGRFVSWVYMLEMSEFILGCFFLLRFLIALIVLTVRYQRRSYRIWIEGGVQVAERCVSTVLIVFFLLICLLSAFMEGGRNRSIEHLPDYVVRIEDFYENLDDPSLTALQPPVRDKSNNFFNDKMTFTVSRSIKFREKRRTEKAPELAVIVEQAIYEFSSVRMADYAIDKYIEGERSQQGEKKSYTDITGGELDPGFDRLYNNGFRYQYCALAGKRVVMFGFYFTVDNGSVPTSDAYNAAFLNAVYNRLAEAD